MSVSRTKGRRWTRDEDNAYRMTMQLRVRLTVDELARVLARCYGPFVLGVERDERGIIVGLMVEDRVVHVRSVRDSVLAFLTDSGRGAITKLQPPSRVAIEAAAAIYEAPDLAWG